MSNWELTEFVVPEVPDKDRFHDFALPLPLMHAIADDTLFVRTEKHLYCIAERDRTK